MSGPLPTVSVIIPTRPGEGTVLALEAARSLDYPPEKLDIIIARGKQPAIQRNRALQNAKGDLVYFLDDDSTPLQKNLHRAAAHFQNPAVQILGGPNLCPPNAPFIEKIFAVVLSSWLAFGPSRARYASIGATRQTTEKELILCNLMARRQTMLDLHGFDESLYPNEENALMDDVQQNGGQLLYDPEFIVYRRPRPNLRAFCKMLMTYGRGRAEQFRLHPTPGSALNFVPPLFCVYLLIGPLLGVWANKLLGPSWALAVAIPGLLYVAAVLAQTLASTFTHGLFKSLVALPLVILSHIFYGLGFWRGLFTNLNQDKSRPITEVSLETIHP